jgi:predicted outer membrane repeat protein
MYNVGSLGAGMYNLDSNPILTNVTFSENDASGKDGGAIYNDNSNPSLTNVTIYKNRALRGSGLFNSNNSAPTLVNSIIWANIDHEYNPNDQVYNETSTTTITYSIIQGGFEGTGNLNEDPLLQELSFNAGLTQSHALFSDSPATDAVSPAFCPEHDQRWYARPFDGDLDGSATCDIGANEYGSYPNLYIYLPFIQR